MDANKILIVDDELSIRVMLARMIEPLKHEVLVAGDGAQALELVRTQGVDLVISDLMMPRMDGLTLLENMRREGFDTAFIILTGFGDLPQALATRDRFNISNFLVKPIHNMDQFLFDVESALYRRRLERENRRLMLRLQGINAQLEEKVHERTHELEQKNAQLRRLSAYRADALKVLGHELRTPLAILSGYHALAGQGEGEDVAAIMPAMRDSIERLQQIVERSMRLLKASETTEFSLDLVPVPPREMCETVVRRLQPLVEHRDIRIYPPAACSRDVSCEWDRPKIEEIVEELLINAIRASHDRSRVEVLLNVSDESVDLAVKDYGSGVLPEQTERIFEPFVTLGKAVHHTSGLFEQGAEGVGIGLSTARMWAKLHGGTIFARGNERHPGMTFHLSLPRKAAPGSSDRIEAERSAADSSTANLA